MYRYSYLNDLQFLKEIDLMKVKEQYVKITVLDSLERPLKEIQGTVLTGSLNLDGKSIIRRTCNLSVYIDKNNNNINSIQNNLFTSDKRIKLEIGFINNTLNPMYSNYDIIWFPLGIYVIANVSLIKDTSGLKLTLQLKDKMCLLNGEFGGTLPAAVTFHEYETTNENGEYVILKPTIYQIIQEVVNHFGGEQLGNILISNIDSRIRTVMKWIGKNPIYHGVLYNEQEKKIGHKLYLDKYEAESEATEIYTYQYGKDIGYIYTDFTFPGELIGEAGSSVCDVLDKIKKVLGNYEYFYDINGKFIFQEIKNYLNTTQATLDLEHINNNDYIVDFDRGKSVYVFNKNNNKLISSFSNNPQYPNIKNDFIIWGERKTAEGLVLPIRYHLSIDKKPSIGNTYTSITYVDPIDNIEKYKTPFVFHNKTLFPLMGVVGNLYMEKESNKIYTWDVKTKQYVFSILPYLIYESNEKLGIENCFYYYSDASQNEQKIYLYLNGSYQLYSDNFTPIQDGNFLLSNNSPLIYKWDNANNKFILITESYPKQDSFPNVDTDIKINYLYYSEEDAKYYKWDILVKEWKEEKIIDPIYFFPNENLLYFNTKTKLFYRWDENNKEFINVKLALNTLIQTQDWRSELFLSGATSEPYGLNSNYYYTELVNEWPKLYDIVKGRFKENVKNNIEAIDYFLDFIDSDGALSELNISNIGRRTKVVVDNNINCLFEPTIPNFILLNTDDADFYKLRQECNERGEEYIQVSKNIFDNIASGGSFNSAYNMMRELLYQYTSYNETITVTSLPIYYLQPNTRITVNDEESRIFGDYMINSISLSLKAEEPMTLSCTKALERF